MSPARASLHKMPRALAMLGAAAMLAVSATSVTVSPIEMQAAGSSGFADSAWAWGDNVYGQLGNSTNGNSSTPVAVRLPSGTTVTAIAGGDNHRVALTSAGRVQAWGWNSYGQLGNGTTSTIGCQCISRPVAVSLPSGTIVTAIAAPNTARG